MSNYLKSELYRLIRKKTLYLFLAICVLVPILMVMMTASVGSERYSNTEFVFKVASSMWSAVFFAIPLIVSIVISDEFTDGTLKNTVAYGISRSAVFYGKWIMSLLVMGVSWALTYLSLSGSAFLLLENNGTSFFASFTSSIPGVLPLTLGAMTVSHCLGFLTGKPIAHLVAYAVVMVILPEVYFMIGHGVPAMIELVDTVPLFPYAAANDIAWARPDGLILCWALGMVYACFAFLASTRLLARKDFN